MSLQQPYEGPLRVIERLNRFYTNERNGKCKTVSVDCLKVTYLDNEAPASASTNGNLVALPPDIPSTTPKLLSAPN